MNIGFAGTPDFAARALEALLASRHRVMLVLTRADKPAGRGLELKPSPVKAIALEHGIAVRQPGTLKHPDEQQALAAAELDALVVAAYGLILPQAVLDAPRRGAFNIHASLLPRWRGAAPIQRALLAGDAQTGISIMQMDAGLDTGAVLAHSVTPIRDEDTAGSLHDRLAALGAELMVRALDDIEREAHVAVPQDDALATYAAKIDKREARIDWNRSASEIHRQVRAFDPMPGCSASLRDAELKIWRARRAKGCGRPGEVLDASDEGIVVACGEDSLRLELLQRQGGRRLPCADFLRGFPVRPGERFAA
jgi:methionyl-tRNA formyltransferase